MQWFDPGGVWTKRAALTLDRSAGGAPATEFAIPLPTAWDEFWDTVDNDGDELRAVGANGSLLQYTLDGFDKSNRVGTLLIDDHQTPGLECMVCAWLYWGSTSAQGNAEGTSPSGTPEDGWIELAQPSGPYVVDHAPAVPGNTQPQAIFAKTAAERADVWVRLPIAGSFTQMHKAPFLEGPRYCTQTVENTSGSDQSSMYETVLNRFVWIPKGPRAGMWVRHLVKAGTSGTNYTSSLVTRFVSPLLEDNGVRAALDTRIGWRVRDARFTS